MTTPQDKKPAPKASRMRPKLPSLRRKRDPDQEKITSWMDEFRNEDSFAMRPVYAIILTITLIALVATAMLPYNCGLDSGMCNWLNKEVDRFGANITTEGFAITFTLIFVDRFLEQQDRRRRLRGSIRALRRAALALEKITNAWAPLISGTLEADPSPPPPSLETLFAPHYTENLMMLDFTRLKAPRDPESPTWIRWAIEEMQAGLDVLSDVGLRYSIILDSSYIEAIDHLIDDQFIDFLNRQLEQPGLDMRTWRVALNTGRGHRESHFTDLVRMLKVHNALAKEAGQVRTRSAGPRTGLLGVELAPDHDLVAPWKIQRTWWKALPPARSLRMAAEA